MIRARETVSFNEEKNGSLAIKIRSNKSARTMSNSFVALGHGLYPRLKDSLLSMNIKTGWIHEIFFV